ncbi:MAG: hypothetical protein WCP20_11155 [Desulfuromonadales bacterium]
MFRVTGVGIGSGLCDRYQGSLVDGWQCKPQNCGKWVEAEVVPVPMREDDEWNLTQTSQKRRMIETLLNAEDRAVKKMRQDCKSWVEIAANLNRKYSTTFKPESIRTNYNRLNGGPDGIIADQRATVVVKKKQVSQAQALIRQNMRKIKGMLRENRNWGQIAAELHVLSKGMHITATTAQRLITNMIGDYQVKWTSNTTATG